jgi:hypothetical protein
MSGPGARPRCPCGRGLEAWRCCLGAIPAWAPDRPGVGDPGHPPVHGVARLADERRAEIARAAADKLLRLGLRPAFSAHQEAAMATFWGDWLEALDRARAAALVGLEAVQAAYTCWMAFDLPMPDGRTLAARLEAGEGDPLAPAERGWLARLAGSRLALYEVEAVRAAEGLAVRDLWTGARLEVAARRAGEQLVRWDLLAARLVAEAPGEPVVLEGGAYPLPTAARGAILRTLRRARREFGRRMPGADDRAFFARQGYRFHHFWLEHVALRSSPGPAAGEREAPDRTPEAGERGAEPGEGRAGAAAAAGLSAIVGAEHHGDWPDRPVPGLGGRTPREAARLPAWRARVVELLKWTENLEARQGRAGGRACDLAWIWRELGLVDEPGAAGAP